MRGSKDAIADRMRQPTISTAPVVRVLLIDEDADNAALTRRALGTMPRLRAELPVDTSGWTPNVGWAPCSRCTFPASAPRAPTAVPAEHERRVPEGSGTILLVEDEDALLAVAIRMLEKGGYHVLEARNGSEALGIATQHSGRIDLVLTDVIMPEMSGGALAERLRAVRPDRRWSSCRATPMATSCGAA